MLLLCRACELAGDELPAPLDPVAVGVLAEQVRPDAAATLSYLREEGVAVKVVSGDSPSTVAAIAAAAGLLSGAPLDRVWRVVSAAGPRARGRLPGPLRCGCSAPSREGKGMTQRADVVVIGGGHNALVAATLLARAGHSTVVLERSEQLGGAVASCRPFPGVDALVSPYAYLVSLFPAGLAEQLGIELALRRRSVASCTPDGEAALVVSDDATRTESSFAALGLGDEYPRWREWQELTARMAKVLAPTLLEPLRPAAEIRDALGPEAWDVVTAQPLGASLEGQFRSDLVRGTVMTDGLIGTFARSSEPSLRQNRCWLYHVVGDGTGDWNVPVGGMGLLATALTEAATGAGVRLRTGSPVVSLDADGRGVCATTAGGERFDGTLALCAAAPAVLDELLGRAAPAPAPEGAQVKMVMVLRRLPALRSGVDPRAAFTGTLHVNERLSQLDAAFDAASGNDLPAPLPCEVYCHSLTDDSVLGAGLQAGGAHTMGLFALQTPARLFAGGLVDRQVAVRACLDSLQTVLAEPIEECLLDTADGEHCLAVHLPHDLEHDLGMPGGNIFHGDLDWPWAEEEQDVGRWGVETDLPNVLVCGAGARRGGGVSGIGGHNAAMAATAYLERHSA